MTGLYINGQKVDLPIGLNLSLILENPVYTKNGTYTLDLELSLLTDRNARAYEFIHRFNKAEDIIDKRSAILIVDGEVVLNGTEDIQSWTTQKVKVVLMSGNSELNFLIGGDRKLRDLSLGEATPIKGTPVGTETQRFADARAVYETLNEVYPQRGWLLLPYDAGMDTDPDDIYKNEWMQHAFGCGNYFGLGVYIFDDSLTWHPGYDAYYSGQVPQPYLCFILERIIESLGYKLEYNVLAEHPVLRYLYIVHGVQTLQFAKMLPSWTVDEFFSKIEFQFNCRFIINPDNKTVELRHYMENEDFPDIVTLDVVNEPNAEIDEENREDPGISNIAYSLESDDYYKFMSLEDAVVKLVSENNMRVVVFTFYELWSKVTDSADNDRFKKIFEYRGDDFIAYDTGVTEDNEAKVVPIKVNAFKALYNNTDSTEIDKELDIIPASMTKMKWHIFFQGDVRNVCTQIPCAGYYDELRNPEESEPEDDNSYNIQDLIEGTDSISSVTAYSKMRLAFYDGLTALYDDVRPDLPIAEYPMAYVENLYEEYSVTKKEKYFNPGGYQDMFRLSNLNNYLYRRSKTIDTTTTYKFNFIYHKKIDIMSKFIINNRAYVCKKLERIVTINGFNDLIEGEFYLLKD